MLKFSSFDDIADQELFRIAFDYLDTDRPHISVVMDASGKMVARAYGPDLCPHPLELIRVIGKRWRYWYSDPEVSFSAIEFDRQARAFGTASTKDLSMLRVGIAGCGGMGSAAVSMLARIGVRKIVLLDADALEESNLNRVHYSTRRDANLRRPKVDVLGEAIASFGLSVNVVRLQARVDDPVVRDAIRSCDLIFGCTDDHLGRNFLNRLAHFYLIPIIDLGLLIEPRASGGYDVFDGRVTVVQPGYPCQDCRELISPDQMLAESLRRSNPELYEQRRRAGYVPDAPDPSPVVVTFTSEVAAMAVNELFQRLNAYRGDAGECSERIRRFDEVKDADTVAGGKRRSNCRLCGRRSYDGRGDMEPFLDMAP